LEAGNEYKYITIATNLKQEKTKSTKELKAILYYSTKNVIYKFDSNSSMVMSYEKVRNIYKPTSKVTDIDISLRLLLVLFLYFELPNRYIKS